MSEYEFGQWIGEATNSSGLKVRMILNFEKRSPGVGQAMNHVPAYPDIRLCSKFKFPKLTGSEVIADFSDVQLFDVTRGAFIPAAEVYKLHGSTKSATPRTTFRFSSNERIMSGSLTTEDGETAEFYLTNTTQDPASEPDHVMTWSQFKKFVASNVPNDGSVIFRGQADNRHKLRTTWHRRNRNNLLEYLNVDIPRLRGAVNSASGFKYSDDDPHFGLLLGLAQHHGYPTPLLDWTQSSEVAAFFAFHNQPVQEDAPQAARIFMFDLNRWPSRTQKKYLCDPLPELHFLGLAHHNNPRHGPQKSVSSFSNVDDIEAFVRAEERLKNRKFLTAIDIPKVERNAVLEDLLSMAITYDSLFPNLEDICRSLTEQHFE